MEKLANENPERFFAFGCSFTNYSWASWADILAYELNCTYYNLGRPGAGNPYIANQIAQANNYFQFNENDLIIVSWTNISREDRYTENGWSTPGNAYSSDEFSWNFLKNYGCDLHYALRDFAYVDFVYNYLRNFTNFNFISMCEITETISESSGNENVDPRLYDLAENYEHVLNKINPSFQKILWDDNVRNKLEKNRKEIHPEFSDNHPTPDEHFRYLRSVFDYNFTEETKQSIQELHKMFVETVCWYNELSKKQRKKLKNRDGDIFTEIFTENARSAIDIREEIPPEIF